MTHPVGRTRRHLALAVLVASALFSSGVATAPAHAGTGLRGQMLQLTNDHRAHHDCAALQLDLQLSRYAKRHSQDMADAGGIFHSDDLAAKLKGKDWSAGGENVGVGTSVTDLEAAFMASTPHRRNILDRDFDHVAIGVVESDGDLWVTVIFYG